MNKVLEFTKKHWKLFTITILIILFDLIALNLNNPVLLSFDDIIYKVINLFKCKSVTIFFKYITLLAGSPFLIILCFSILLLFKNKQNGSLVVLNVANTVTINVILKELFSRPRPYELIMIEETGYSFPSGHSMAAMAFYGFLIYLIWKNSWKRKNKVLATIILSSIILLVGISRIYLGVHYASDVIGGFLISFVYLILFTWFVSEYNLAKEKDKKSLSGSFKYAFSGIKTNLLKERNLLIHIYFIILVIISGFVLKISVIEWFVCIILFGMVISLELLNTAIEATVDLAMPDINPKAKLAKDTAAAAVLVSAITAAIIGIIIFIPKFINIWR